jgi:hypothetical protein
LISAVNGGAFRDYPGDFSPSFKIFREIRGITAPGGEVSEEKGDSRIKISRPLE